jgi:hypothetical protein
MSNFAFLKAEWPEIQASAARSETLELTDARRLLLRPAHAGVGGQREHKNWSCDEDDSTKNRQAVLLISALPASARQVRRFPGSGAVEGGSDATPLRKHMGYRFFLRSGSSHLCFQGSGECRSEDTVHQVGRSRGGSLLTELGVDVVDDGNQRA